MTAESIALSLILVSAMSHALIGAIMKRANNKLIFRGILGATTALIMTPFISHVPFPPSSVWVVLALSVFIHLIYHVAQALAFTHGDMSFVYPIMR